MRNPLAVSLFVLLMLPAPQDEEPTSRPLLEAFDWAELSSRMEDAGEGWRKFLDRPSLYAGVYRLAAGAEDGQQPHLHDEVYYVVRGRALLEVEGERTPAGSGAILFVAAGAEHRFVEIEEDLEVLVFFSRGPADAEPPEDAEHR